MDYKYIEQLMERYFNCETTLQEEQILRSFFQQEEIPEQLRAYADLFRYEGQEAEQDRLGDDFDAKILSMVEQPVVRARRISLRSRLYPLFKAAATVAIILTIGNAAQHSFYSEDDAEFQQPVTMQPEMSYQPKSPLEMTAEEVTPAQAEATLDTVAVIKSPAGGY